MIKKRDILLLVILCVFSLRGLAESLSLESSGFQTNTLMPEQYTCHGANHSPPLSWQGVPEGTQSFVLIVEDPDAPNGTWVHWLLFNIPAKLNHLDEATELPEDVISGKNSWDKSGYGGPCPPTGIHHYKFILYALDARLTVNSSVYKPDILNAMQHHIIQRTELIGLYGN